MLIETERLRLRDLQVADVPALVQLWTDPDVTEFMGGPRNAAELRSIFQEDAARTSLPETDDLWPVVERASDRVIGHCGLLEKDVEGRPEVELIYVVDRSVWGRGYATEAAQALRDYAFQRLKLERIIALIDPENVASERVAQKVGMRFEREVVRDGGAVRRVYALSSDSDDLSSA